MFVYIYKLIKKDALNDDMVYIGSTEDINDRMSKHKYSCNNIKNQSYNCKVYKYIRDNGGWDEWKYEIVDEVEVALRNDAARYEGEYIIKYDAINKLNDIVAGRTIKQYQKENYQQNIEHILQKHKQYREQNKEQNKQKDKETYERNKEHILQRCKEYREKNKDLISQKRKEQRRLAKLNTL
mgnify:FL=1